MKKLRLVALSALLVSSSAFAADQARSIMDKADARDDGASMVSTMQMTLIDKNNKQRIRQMRTFSKDVDANTEHKTIFFFIA